MPELPEVETIRRDLEPLVTGRRVEGVAIHAGGERVAITHPPRELEAQLRGRRIEGGSGGTASTCCCTSTTSGRGWCTSA